MSGGPTPYEVQRIRIGVLAEALLAVFDAANHESDAALFNVAKHLENDSRFSRELLETERETAPKDGGP